MKFITKLVLVFTIGLLMSCANEVDPPEPFDPIPSARQLQWHDMEYYAFIHFSINTFTDMEWGDGSEKPEQFNPTKLDAKQWAKTIKDAGMKGVIITAKHHDGFCLWPSKYTEHSVKNSPWKNGKGDVLKELSEACKEYGLKMGVYLSPWDRNHAQYGQPEYVDYFHNQIRELLTNYGDIFEVWFDGANGGSGYYGGANETRKIDNKTYYEWDKAVAIVRELQPDAVIFSDCGPDVRWVGNEEGWAKETNWSLLRRDEVYPGYLKYKELRSGHEDGTHWVPAECDVSIRPGWYYHAAEDTQVKSLEHLVNIYYESVGRNASLLLNLPVDNRGLVHEKDVAQLMALKQQIDKDFSENLALGVQVSATNHRSNSKTYHVNNIIDKNPVTYWATDDEVKEATVTLTFNAPTAVNRILLEEYIPLGQRVKSFTVEAEVNGAWKQVDSQTTIGDKRILRFDTVETTKLKLNIKAKAAITIANLEVYHAPNLLTQPTITRNVEGLVTMNVADKNVEVYYTTNREAPSHSSTKYEKPFMVDKPTTLKVVAYDPQTKQQTATKQVYFDISKKHWKVLKAPSKELSKTSRIIDDNVYSTWVSDNSNAPKEVVVDLGSIYNLKGFTYMPMQGRWPKGIISNYEFFVSTNNRSWKSVAKGEFSNIKNNPIEQVVNFDSTKGRYIKLKAVRVINENTENISVAELGVITN
jgi:alpha-L-fucosidase